MNTPEPSATLTYEQMQSRPPSAVVLAVCVLVAVIGLCLDLFFADTLPLPFLMGTILFSGIAAAVFAGMAWTYRKTPLALLIFVGNVLVWLSTAAFNVYTLRELALKI